MYRELRRYIESILGTTFFLSASATPTNEEFSVSNWIIKDIAGIGSSSIMVAAFYRYTA